MKRSDELVRPLMHLARLEFGGATPCLGLDELRNAIVERLGNEASLAGNEGVIITERRHREALLRAVTSLEAVLSSAENVAPLECLAMDLRESLASLGQITGETTPDEILDHIFSRFCIGK